jgi:NAD(P)-dependent dehydrogenase (short-subunit alcohol dehydrogenase family)
MEISLDGKVALVTGASKGIGKAIAATLASSGSVTSSICALLLQPHELCAQYRQLCAEPSVARAQCLEIRSGLSGSHFGFNRLFLRETCRCSPSLKLCG